jgi:hypothetical protein
MESIFDTLIQSCEELGTLQQDGNIFLSGEEVEKCKNLHKNPVFSGIGTENRYKKMTTEREQYIQFLLRKFENLKKRFQVLDDNYNKNITELKIGDIDLEFFNLEKTKYNLEINRLLDDIKKEKDLIMEGISNKYYGVETIQYKNLTNLMERISNMDYEKTKFKDNLDTTEEQLKILLYKRARTQKKYNAALLLFSLCAILFGIVMIYYLFSKNTL